MKFLGLNQGALLGYGPDVIGYHQALIIIAANDIQHDFFLIGDKEVSKVLEQMYEDQKSGKDKESYEMTPGEKVTVDISPVEAKIRRLIMIPTGEKIYFKNPDSTFTVRAKSLQYLIVTKYPNGEEYSIIDTFGGTCGPNDRTFNPYNMKKTEDVLQALEDLKVGKINISHTRKRGAYIPDVIDLDKTFKVFGH